MLLDRFTKALLLVIAACLVILCGQRFVQPSQTVHGASTNLQFTADKDRLYFFDPEMRKVYVYPVNGGRLQSSMQLVPPGNELRPVATY